MIKMKDSFLERNPLQTKDDVDSGHGDASQEGDEVQAWVRLREVRGVWLES